MRVFWATKQGGGDGRALLPTTVSRYGKRLIVNAALSEQLNAELSSARFWWDMVLKQGQLNHAFQQQSPLRIPGMPTAESSPKQSLSALLSRLSLTDNTGALRSLSGKRASFLLPKLHALVF